MAIFISTVGSGALRWACLSVCTQTYLRNHTCKCCYVAVARSR